MWLGWQDSNLRIPESKSGALPLGDIPMCARPASDTHDIIAWVLKFCNYYFSVLPNFHRISEPILRPIQGGEYFQSLDK